MINLIVAVNEDFAMGDSVNNTLLYHISEDLKRFRKLTLNNFTLYGRTTYESLPKLFDKRTNVILTRNKKFKINESLLIDYDVIIENDISKILNLYKNSGFQEKELFICGGAEIYSEAIKWCDNIYLTMIHDKNHPNGDVFFPKEELKEFKEISREKHLDEKLNLEYSYINYIRKEEIYNDK